MSRISWLQTLMTIGNGGQSFSVFVIGVLCVQ